jgi:2,4-dienoyl-CoA reductase (NADPH2)
VPARNVMVVGAGPAGLQAAISCAQAGHHVVVYERNEVAGGQLRWAATVPNRAEIGDLVRNQVGEARRLGVKIAYGHEVDAGFVRAQGPDVVIVATGAKPARPYWAPPGPADDPSSRVVDVLDVLAGAAVPSGRVVIVDELGFHQATSVAEVLAERGCAVEIVTPGMVVGQDLGVTLDLEHFCIRAAAAKMTLTPDHVVMGYARHDDGSSSLSLLHHVSGSMVERPCDWVVLAVPGQPCDALYDELVASGVEVHRIGDAVAPRRAHSAVIDGDRVVAAL